VQEGELGGVGQGLETADQVRHAYNGHKGDERD
jgi:hypothetical protein